MSTILRSEHFISLERVTAYLRRAQDALTTLGRNAAEKHVRLQEALHESENHLRKLLRQGRITLTRLRRNAASKPRGLQATLRARENGLQMLLASSLDAIVVINSEHRFVDANPKGLDLFGISETNEGKFAIDAFLSDGQIPQFAGNGSAFARRTEKQGKCEIRRLDGSLRVAEYVFVANFAPFRHLCRFRNIAAIDQYRPATLRTLGNQSRIGAKSDASHGVWRSTRI